MYDFSIQSYVFGIRYCGSIIINNVKKLATGSGALVNLLDQGLGCSVTRRWVLTERIRRSVCGEAAKHAICQEFSVKDDASATC